VPTIDDLIVTSDQADFNATLRSVLADISSPAVLRQSMDTDRGYDEQTWKRLTSEIGLSAVTVPEEFGGLGLGPAEAAGVHTELGRALYPGPFLATHLLTVALLASGDRDAQAEWLPQISQGDVVGAVAAADKAGRWSTSEATVAARTDGDRWSLYGTRWFVVSGHVADLLLVPAGTGRDRSLFLVPTGPRGVRADPVPGLDLTRRVATVSFDGAPATLLGIVGAAQPVLDAVRTSLLLATAAEAAGGIGWCLDTSVAYAKTREQFGRPIGSFQSVAHNCVDMLADHELASAAARYAAVACAQDADDHELATRVAVLRNGQAYRRVTEATIHLLGGLGFTWEHDAHLYYRRAWSGQLLAGHPHEHRDAIATLAGA
jgi:alkylation response protein AidB-like acyl-CoA dehydrogenase